MCWHWARCGWQGLAAKAIPWWAKMALASVPACQGVADMNFARAWPVISTRIIAAFCLVSGALAQRAVAAEVALEDN